MAEGALNMLKPPGMTSHDVVDGVRRIVQMRRVGHAGTLDPAAAGVMLLMLGSTTRLSEYMTGCDKTYRAEISLGIGTDTLDGEGKIVARESAAGIGRDDLEQALQGLTGSLSLPPPMHSAVWHDGRRLYQIARAGDSVEVEDRKSRVHRFELLEFEMGETARALTEVECSSGTYVRSLAAAVGEAVGCLAYLSFLVRTAVGQHSVVDSLTGSELSTAVRERRLGEVLIRPQDALPPWPRIEVDPTTALALCHGVQTPAPPELMKAERAIAMTGERLLCVVDVIADEEQHLMQPRRVMLSEDEL